MIVPELPEDVRALKEAVGRFVEAEVYPLGTRIAERGSIDPAELDSLRRKARDAGFSMLSMPPDLGGRDLSMLGQVALEEESGKATNGLGFAVVDRGPRELHEIATPEQIERYVRPIANGEYREAWALTEPGAGSDLTGLEATAVCDGDEWVLNGEKWFVTSEGEPGVYIVLAVAEGEQMLFLVDPGAPGIEIVRTPSFLHDAYIDHHPEIVFRDCRVPDANRGGEWVDPRRAALHRPALLRCGAPARRSDGRLGAGARDVRLAGRRVPGDLVSARRLPNRASRRPAPDVPRGARLRRPRRPQGRAREGLDGEAVRVGDGRASGGWCGQAFGDRGYMVENAAARFYRELRVDRIWEGTSEIQRSIISRGVFKRAAAPCLS